MASVEPIRLKPFLRAMGPLAILWSIPFVGFPVYFILNGDNDLGGWMGVAVGSVTTLCISTILSLLLVRRWGFAFYVLAFSATFFSAASIGNVYAALSTSLLTIFAVLIYHRQNKKA